MLLHVVCQICNGVDFILEMLQASKRNSDMKIEVHPDQFHKFVGSF